VTATLEYDWTAFDCGGDPKATITFDDDLAPIRFDGPNAKLDADIAYRKIRAGEWKF
jgi:hypothetical protein